MSNFLNLTKVFFLTGYAVNKKKKNQRSTFTTLALFGLLFLALSSFYNFMIIGGLDKEVPNIYENYLTFILAISAMLVLVLTLTQMQGTIFKTKDYEFLESLPVGKTTIVAAKITSVYFMSFFEDLVIALPAVVLYLVFTGNIINFLIGFLSIFFVSLLPLMISSFLSALMTIFTAKSKHGNILQTIIYIIYFVGIFAVSFTISSNASTGINVNSVQNFLIYFKWLDKAFIPETRYYFLFFILLHLASFAIVVVFIGGIYRPMNAFVGNARIHTEYKEGMDSGNYSHDKMLFKKELKMITSNSQYLVNSFLGPVFMLVMGIFFLFMKFPGMEDMDVEDTAFVGKLFAYLVVYMGILMNSMMSSTPSSISLESKCFESLLAYPLKAKDVIKAKLKVAIIILVSLNLIAGAILSIIYSVVNGFNLLFVLQIMILPSLVSMVTSVTGMLTGLRWPKLDFQNQMQVMKNSKSVSLLMLFVGLPGFFISIGILVLDIFMPLAGLIGGVLLYSIALIIVLHILKKHGVSLYYKVITR